MTMPTVADDGEGIPAPRARRLPRCPVAMLLIAARIPTTMGAVSSSGGSLGAAMSRRRVSPKIDAMERIATIAQLTDIAPNLSERSICISHLPDISGHALAAVS